MLDIRDCDASQPDKSWSNHKSFKEATNEKAIKWLEKQSIEFQKPRLDFNRGFHDGH
jgi:hypothetical protein